VVSAVALKTGALRLVFDTGSQLRVPKDDGFEAWNARGPGSILVVSLPGGELAVWR